MEKRSFKLDTKKRWTYVVLSILLMMIYGTVYSWSVFRIPVENIYNVGATLSGLPYMMFLLVYAISMLIGGKLIGKYSSASLLISGGVLIFIGWLLSSFSSGILLLTISYGVFIGFGVGISYGVPIYVIAKWFPENKGMVIGFVLAGFGLSPLITAPLGEALITNFGLSKTFLYYAIGFGIIIPIISILIKEPEYDIEYSSGDVVEEEHEDMLKTKSFKFAYICFFIGTLIGLTIIGLTSIVGKELIGIETHNIALMIILFALLNGTGRPFFGWMTEKFGPTKTMKLSYGLIISASILMLFAKQGYVLLYLLSFSILWLNLGAWLAIAPMMTIDLYGMKNYSRNYGIMFTAYGVGAVVGVISTGLLIDLLGNFKSIFILLIIISVLGYFLSNKVKN